MEAHLNFISFVDEEMETLEGTPLKYRITGGWAVDGIIGEITRAHENVDVMVPKENIPRFKNSLEKYGLDVQEEGEGMCGKGRGVLVDIVKMYPVGEDYAFDTPYHNPGAPVPKRLLKGKRVELEGVEFTALNATALYFAKLTTKGRSEREYERDNMDVKKLAPFVNPKLREEMRAYARV